MNEALARLVRARARRAREYCLLPETATVAPFEIDPIIARKHGGISEEDNLALSCFYCNSAKGPNIAGIDPESGFIVRLFHPRKDIWGEHFQWSGESLIGMTSIGRATINVLQMNQPDMRILRWLLRLEGQAPRV